MKPFKNDRLERIILNIKLFFTRDKKKRQELLVCLALTTVVGRRKLAEAMVEPIKREVYSSRNFLKIEPLSEEMLNREI